MEIPVTIATVIALENSLGKSYVDATQTFIFFGIATAADVESVYDCVAEMVLARTNEVDEATMYNYFEEDTFYNLKEVVFTEGQVSVRWEQRL